MHTQWLEMKLLIVKHARHASPCTKKREKHSYICAKMISVCNLYAKTENSESSYNNFSLVQHLENSNDMVRWLP